MGVKETDPFFDDVSLLMHMNGADASTTFTEETGKAVTVFGNTQIDTAFSQFGGASGLFDGSGDYLELADSVDWQFGTGDFTIEGWVYNPASSGTESLAYYGDPSALNNINTGWALLHNTTNGLVFSFANGSTQYNVIDATPLSDATWHFVQVVRESGTIKIRANGTETKTQSQPQSINAPAGSKLLLGRRFASAISYFSGNLDDWRITKGVARANVVPTAQFPDS